MCPSTIIESFFPIYYLLRFFEEIRGFLKSVGRLKWTATKPNSN